MYWSMCVKGCRLFMDSCWIGYGICCLWLMNVIIGCVWQLFNSSFLGLWIVFIWQFGVKRVLVLCCGRGLQLEFWMNWEFVIGVMYVNRLLMQLGMECRLCCIDWCVTWLFIWGCCLMWEVFEFMFVLDVFIFRSGYLFVWKEQWSRVWFGEWFGMIFFLGYW